jgi:hypothetical protein
MYIETSNQALQSLYDADLMGDQYDPPGVEFSATGVAQVTQEVGERLVERYDTITVKDSE